MMYHNYHLYEDNKTNSEFTLYSIKQPTLKLCCLYYNLNVTNKPFHTICKPYHIVHYLLILSLKVI